MWRNTVAINNVLKKKNYKTKFSIGSILKKIKSTNIILENKKIKKKNHVKKHYSDSQYFKGKKIQSEIFNQLNIKKVKLTKRILGKKRKKEKKRCKKRNIILIFTNARIFVFYNAKAENTFSIH